MNNIGAVSPLNASENTAAVEVTSAELPFESVTFGTTENVTGDIAKAKLPTFVVLHTANGDVTAEITGWTINDLSSTTAGDYTATASFTLPDGYTFTNGSTTVTATVHIANSYLLSFSRGSTDTTEYTGTNPDSVHVYEGQPYTLPDNPYTSKSGYTFKGWSTDGGATLYTERSVITPITNMPFQAIWDVLTYITQVGALDSVNITTNAYSSWSALQSAKGTDNNSLLPKTVTLYYGEAAEDGTMSSVTGTITWNNTQTYDGTTEGAYVISGTFAVPDTSKYALSGSLTNAITMLVNVSNSGTASNPTLLTGLNGTIADVTIGNGEYEDFEAVDNAGILPDKITMKDSSGKTYTVTVKSWALASDAGFSTKYNNNSAAANTYVLTADLDLDNTLDYSSSYTAPTMKLVVANQYRVTYNTGIPAASLVAASNVSSDSVSVPASQLVTGGWSITLGKVSGADSLTAYVFKGWSDGSNSYSVGSSYTVKGNVTLTALWDKYVEGIADSIDNGGLVEQSGFTAYLDDYFADRTDMNELADTIYLKCVDGTLVSASIEWAWPSSTPSIDTASTFEYQVNPTGTVKLPNGYILKDGGSLTVKGTLCYIERTFTITNKDGEFGVITKRGDTETFRGAGADANDPTTITIAGTDGDDTFNLSFTSLPTGVTKLVIGSASWNGADKIVAKWNGGTTIDLPNVDLVLYGRTITLTPQTDTTAVTLNLKSLTIQESPKSRLLGIQNQFNSDNFSVKVENFNINTTGDITISVYADYNATIVDDLGIKNLLTSAISTAQTAAGAAAGGVSDAAVVTTETLQGVYDKAATDNSVPYSVDVASVGSDVSVNMDELVSSMQAYDPTVTAETISDELTTLANSSLFVDIRIIRSAIELLTSSLISGGKLSVTSTIKLGMNVLGYFFPVALSVADIKNTITVTDTTLKAAQDLILQAYTDVVNNASAGAAIKIPAGIALSVNNVDTVVKVNKASALTSLGGSVNLDADADVSGAVTASVSKSGDLQSALIIAIQANEINTSATLEDTASITAKKDVNITSDQSAVTETTAKVSRRTVTKQHQIWNLALNELISYFSSLGKAEADMAISNVFTKGSLEGIEAKLNESTASISTKDSDIKDEKATDPLAAMTEGTIKIQILNSEKAIKDAEPVQGAVVKLWYVEDGSTKVTYTLTTDQTGYAAFNNLRVDLYHNGTWYYQLISVPKKIQGGTLQDFTNTTTGINLSTGESTYSTVASGTISLVNGGFDRESGNGSTSVASGSGTKKNSTRQLVGAFGVEYSVENNTAAVYSSGLITAGGNVNILANGVSNHETYGEATAILPETSDDAAAMEIYVYDPNGNPLKGVEITLTATVKAEYNKDDAKILTALKDVHGGKVEWDNSAKSYKTITWTTKTDSNGIASFVVSPWYSNIPSNLSNKIGTSVNPTYFSYAISIPINASSDNIGLYQQGYRLTPWKFAVNFTQNSGGSYSWNKTVTLTNSTLTGSNAKSKKAVGVGVGIAAALINYNNEAYVSGNANIVANGLTVSALSGQDEDDKVHNLSTVYAGAGYNVGDFGFGGAIALNVFNTSTTAIIDEGAHITLGTGTLSVIAKENGSTSTSALTIQDGIITKNLNTTEAKGNTQTSTSTGVGTGIAVSVYNNDVFAVIKDGHYIQNKKETTTDAATGKTVTTPTYLSDINIIAESEGTVTTTAEAGSQGGRAITPVLAIDVLVEQVRAMIGLIGEGVTPTVLNVSGNATVSASGSKKKTMNANASASGNRVAFGGAFGVSVDTYETKAYVAQDLYLKNGSLRIMSSGSHSSESRSDGSANGAGNDGTSDGQGSEAAGSSTEAAGSTAGSANKQQSIDRQANILLNTTRQVSNRGSAYGLPSKTPVSASTNAGAVSIAGALVLTIYNNSTTAILDANATVRYGLDISASDAENLSTVADSSSTVSKIGVGVSVALQVVNSETRAYITNTAKDVEAGSISITALRRQSSDTANSYYLRSTSGAGASNVGVAGSVTVAVLNLESDAYVNMGKADTDTETPKLIATEGSILVYSDLQNKSESRANATTYREVSALTATQISAGTGVGASFGLIVLTPVSDAYIGNGNALLVKAAKDVRVKAQLDDKVTLNVVAGTESSVNSATGMAAAQKTGISLDAVVAIPVINAEQKASILKNVTVYAGGDLSAIAENKSYVSTTTKGAATAGSIASGASIAVNVVYQDILAELANDGAIGGNLVVEATTDTDDLVDGIATAAGLSSNLLGKFSQVQSTINSILNGQAILQAISNNADSVVSGISSAATAVTSKTSTSSTSPSKSDDSTSTAKNKSNADKDTTKPADVATGSVTKSGEKSNSSLDFFTNLVSALKDYITLPAGSSDTSSIVDTSKTSNTTASSVTGNETKNNGTSNGSNNKASKSTATSTQGLSLAIGAAFGVNIISHDVTARYTGKLVRAGGALVHAANKNDFKTHSTGAAVSRAEAIAGGVSVLVNNSDTIASLSGTVNIVGSNNDNNIVTNGIPDTTSSGTTSEGSGSGSTGSSSSTESENGSAYVKYAAGNVLVIAETTHDLGIHDATAEAIAGAASMTAADGSTGTLGVSLTGAFAIVSSNCTTDASVADGSVITIEDGDLYVSSYEKSRLSVRALSGNFANSTSGTGLGIGAAIAVLEATEKMNASIGTGAAVTANNVAVLAQKAKITRDDVPWTAGINGYIELGKEEFQYGFTSADKTDKLYKKIQINTTSEDDDKTNKLSLSGTAGDLVDMLKNLVNQLTAANYYLEAIGGGAATSSNGVATTVDGSIAVIYFKNTVNASIGSGTTITLNEVSDGGAVKVNAGAEIRALMLTGGIGITNANSIGVSAASIADDDAVTAVIGSDETGSKKVTINNIQGDTGLDVRATLKKDINLGGAAAAISAAGSSSGLGVDGVVGINVSDSSAKALVYNTEVTGASGTGLTPGSVTVLSENTIDMLKILGGLSLVTEANGIGVGASIGIDVINAKAYASVDSKSKLGTSADPVGAVLVQATGSERIITILINGAGSTTAAVSASPVVQVFNADTEALLNAASVYASSVTVKAVHPTTLVAIGGAFAVSAKTGTGVGASIAVDVFNKKTIAQFGTDSASTVVGISGDVQVSADSKEDIRTFVASLGVSTQAVAVSGSVNVLVSHNTTTAETYTKGTIGGKLADTAKDDLYVLAGSGAIAVSAYSSVGLATTDVIVSNTTKAFVYGGANSTNNGTVSDSDALIVTGDTSVEAASEETFFVITVPVTVTYQVPASVAVSPGVTTLILKETTDAQLGGKVTAKSAAVRATDSTDIKGFTIALAGSAITSEGASVSTFTYDKTVKALVPAGSSITTTAEDIKIQAENKDDELFVTVGFYASGIASAGGSVSTIVCDSDVSAGTGENVTLSSAGNVIVTVENDLDIMSVTGAGTGGLGAAVGAAVNTYVFSGTNIAEIGKNNTITAGKGTEFKWWDGYVEGTDENGNCTGKYAYNETAYTGVIVGAKSDEKVTMIAVSGGAGAFAGAIITGAVNTVVFKETTAAQIGEGTKVTSAGDVAVLALDITEYLSVAGQASALGSAVYGVGVDTLVFNKTVTASIGKSANVTAEGNIYVHAGSYEDIDSVSAGLSAGSALTKAGAVSTVTLSNTVSALAGADAGSSNAITMTAGGSISIFAEDVHKVKAVAGLAAISGSASYGAGVSTIVESSNVNAQAGPYSDIFASGNSAIDFVTYNIGTKKRTRAQRRGVQIGAFNIGSTSQTVFSASTGSAESAAAAVATWVNNAKAQAIVNTSARINQTGSRNRERHSSSVVSVTAVNDSDSESHSAGASLSLPGISAVAGTSYSAATLVVASSRTTQAKVESGAVIDGRGGVDVTAASGNDMDLYGFGLGGGLTGMSGTATVYILKDTTTAQLAGTVTSNGTVNVLADSDQDVTLVSATGDFAGAAFGGAGAVFKFNGTTEALLANGTSIQAKAVNVKATGNSDLDSYAVAGAAGEVAVSGSVNIAIVENTVKAVAGSNVTINAVTGSNTYGDINFLAEDTTGLTANTGNVAASGELGAGGAVTVVIYRSTVTAGIGSNASVTGKNVNVKANANRKVTAYTVAGALGTNGSSVAGSVLVVLVGTDTDDDIKSALKTTNMKLSKADSEKDTDTVSDGSTAYQNADTTIAAGFEDAAIESDSVASNGNNEGNEYYTAAIESANSAISGANPGASSVATVFTATGTADKTSAYITSGNVTAKGGSITIEANEKNELTLVSGAASGSGGGAGVGGAVLITKLYGTTEAMSGANLTADTNVTISTSSTNTGDNLYTVAGSVGLVSLGAAVNYLYVGSESKAYASAGTIQTGGTVNIKANSSNSLKPKTGEAGVSAATAGIATSVTTLNAGTHAYLGADASITKAVKGVNITASSNINTQALTAAISAGLLAAGNGSVATMTIYTLTEAYSAGSISHAANQTIGDVLIQAQLLSAGAVKAGAVQLSGRHAGGASVATFTLSPLVLASSFGAVNIDGTLTVNALYNYYSNLNVRNTTVNVEAYAVSAARTAAFSGAKATTAIDGGVLALIHNPSSTTLITARNIAVNALADIREKTYTGDANVGTAAVGASIAKAESEIIVLALVGGNMKIEDSITINGVLQTVHNVTAKGLSGGLVGTGIAQKATLVEESEAGAMIRGSSITYNYLKDIMGYTSTDPQTDTKIEAGGAVILNGNVKNTANVTAQGVGVAMGLTVGSSQAFITVDNAVSTDINGEGRNITMEVGSLAMNSYLSNTQKANVTATAAGLITAVSNAEGTISDEGSVYAFLDGGSRETGDKTYTKGSVKVNAKKNNTTGATGDIAIVAEGVHNNTLNVSSKNGSVAAAGFSKGTITSDNTVYVTLSYMDANNSITLNAEGDVDLISQGSQTVNSTVTGGTGGCLGTSNDIVSDVKVYQTIRTWLGTNTTVTANGTVRIMANNDKVYIRSNATINWSAGGLTFLDTDANAQAWVKVNVLFGSVTVKGADIYIQAFSDRVDINAKAYMTTVAVINTQSKPTAYVLADISTCVTATGKVSFEATGTLSIIAKSDGDISTKAESYGKTSGVTGSVISTSSNYTNAEALIKLADTGNYFVGNTVIISASAPIESEMYYKNDASYTADTVTEWVSERVYYANKVVEKLTEKLVKKLPWPLNKIVKWIVKTVVKVVEWFEDKMIKKVLQSETKEVENGDYKNTATVTLNGKIKYGKSVNPSVIIDSQGNVTGVSSSEYTKDDTNKTITFNSLGTATEGRLYIEAYAGTITGNVEVHNNNIVAAVNVTNNSEYTVRLPALNLEEIDTNSGESYQIVGENTDGFNMEDVTDNTDTPTITITGTQNANVVFLGNVTNLGAILTVDLNSKGGSVYFENGAVLNVHKAVFRGIKDLGASDNRAALNLYVIELQDGSLENPTLSVDASDNVFVTTALYRYFTDEYDSTGTTVTKTAETLAKEAAPFTGFDKLHVAAGGTSSLLFDGAYLLYTVDKDGDNADVSMYVATETETVSITLANGTTVDYLPITKQQATTAAHEETIHYEKGVQFQAPSGYGYTYDIIENTDSATGYTLRKTETATGATSVAIQNLKVRMEEWDETVTGVDEEGNPYAMIAVWVAYFTTEAFDITMMVPASTGEVIKATESFSFNYEENTSYIAGSLFTAADGYSITSWTDSEGTTHYALTHKETVNGTETDVTDIADLKVEYDSESNNYYATDAFAFTWQKTASYKAGDIFTIPEGYYVINAAEDGKTTYSLNHNVTKNYPVSSSTAFQKLVVSGLDLDVTYTYYDTNGNQLSSSEGADSTKTKTNYVLKKAATIGGMAYEANTDISNLISQNGWTVYTDYSVDTTYSVESDENATSTVGVTYSIYEPDTAAAAAYSLDKVLNTVVHAATITLADITAGGNLSIEARQTDEETAAKVDSSKTVGMNLVIGGNVQSSKGDVTLNTAAVPGRDNVTVSFTNASNATITAGGTSGSNGTVTVNTAKGLTTAKTSGTDIKAATVSLTTKDDIAASAKPLLVTTDNFSAETKDDSNTVHDVYATITPYTSGSAVTIKKVGADDAALTVNGSTAESNITTAGTAALTVNGNAAKTNITSGKDATVSVTGSATNTTITAATGNVTLTADSAAATKITAATGDVTLTAAQSAAGTVIEATKGNVTVTATNGDAGITSITSGKSTTVIAGGNITGGTVSAGTDATLTAHNNINVNTVDAKNHATLRSVIGSITAQTVTAGNDASITALENIDVDKVTAGKNNVSVNSTDGNVKVGTVSAETYVTLSAGGDLTAKEVTAKTNVETRAGGSTTATTISAGETASIQSNRDVNINDTIIGKEVTVISRQGDVTVKTGTAQNDLSITASKGSIDVTTGTSGNDAVITSDENTTIGTLTATAGNATVTSGETAKIGTATTGNNLTVTAKTGDVEIETGSAGNDLTLTADKGAVKITGTGSAGNDFNITAQKDITVKTGTADNDLTITSYYGDISVDKGTAVHDLNIKAQDGNVTLTTGTAGNDALILSDEDTKITTLTVTAGDAEIESNGDAEVGTLTVTAGSAEINSEGNTKIETGSAGKDLEIISMGTAEAGTLSAGRNVLVDSEKAATLGTLTATSGDITVDSGKTVTLTSGTAGNNLAVTSTTGDITASYLNGKQVALKADNGSFVAGDLAEGKKANIYAENLTITAKGGNIGSWDTPVKTDLSGPATLEATADGSIYITDVDGDVNATSVTSQGDIVLETNGDTSVGTADAGNDLAITVKGVGSDLTLYTGKSGNDLVITTDGDAAITTAESGNDMIVTTGGDTKIITSINSGNDMTVTTGGDADIASSESGNDMTVKVGKDTEIGTATSGNNLVLTTDGNATITTINSGNNLDITTGGNTSIDTGTAGNNMAVTSGGTTTVGIGTAGRNLTVNSGSSTTITQGTAGNDITVNSDTGDITAGYLDGNKVKLTTENGSVVPGELQDDHTANIYANDLTITVTGGNIGSENTPVRTDLSGPATLEATADGPIYITDVDGDVNATSIISQGDIVLETNGDTTVGTADAGNDLTITVKGDGSDLTLDTGKSGNDLVITTDGDAAITTAESGNDMTVTIGGDTKVTTLIKSGNDMTVTTGGDADIASAESGNDLQLIVDGDAEVGTASSGNNFGVEVDGNAKITDINSGNDLTVTVGKDTEIGTATSGNDLVLTTDGDAAITTINSGNNLDITTGGNTSVETATSGAGLTVTSTNGNTTIQKGEAGQDLTVTSGGDTSVGTGTAGQNLTVTSGSSTTITDATAGNDITVNSDAGDITVGHLDAKNVGLTTGNGNVVAGDLQGDHAANIYAENLTITANGGNIGSEETPVRTDLSDPAILTAAADGSIYITDVDGEVNVPSITAKDGDIVLETNGDTKVDIADAGNNLTITVNGEDSGLTLDTGKAGNDLTITSAGSADIVTSLTAENVKVTGNTISLNGQVTSGQTEVNAADLSGYIDSSMGITVINLDRDGSANMTVRSTDDLTVNGTPGNETVTLDFSGASRVGIVQVDGKGGTDLADISLNSHEQTGDYTLRNLSDVKLTSTEASENITLTDADITFDQRKVTVSNVGEMRIVNPGGNNYWTFIDTPTVLTIYSGAGDDTYQIGVLSAKNGYIRTTEGFLTRGTSYGLTINDDQGNNRFIIFSAQTPVRINGRGDVLFRRFWIRRGGRYVLYKTAAILLNGKFRIRVFIPPDPNRYGNGYGIGGAGISTASPDTGDTNRTLFWLMLMLAAMLGIAVSTIKRRNTL